MIGRMTIRLKKVDRKHVGRYDFRRLRHSHKQFCKKWTSDRNWTANDGDVEKDLKMRQESIHSVKEKYLQT